MGTVYPTASNLTAPMPCTVAQLPTLAASATALVGLRWVVTDATVAPAGNFGATVAGGGTHLCPVTNMGANWIIG